jgi:hypothetical protein
MTSPLRTFPLVALFSLVSACGYGDDDAPDDYYDYGDCGGRIEEATIDTGETLEIDPGVGAGAFLEYEEGGVYRLTTACDTETYGYDCPWDVVLTALDGAVIAIEPYDLESEDSLAFIEGDSVRLVSVTGTDLDGFTLLTDPGTAVRFDAFLDGACANRYMFWVGDGALHNGAPSNPVDIVPSAP